MTKKTGSFCILATLFAFIISACGDDNEAAQAGYNIDQDEDNTTVTIDENYVYKLPVIFHVLYSDRNDKTQYVDATRLKDILNNVNEIYQGGIYGQSENVKVRFVLASVDENGRQLETPGVEYVRWTDTYPINPYTLMGDNTRKYIRYIWDPNEYINVLVYHFKSENKNGTTLGVSHMPYSIRGNNTLEGLSIINYPHLSKGNLSYAYCTSLNSQYINQESSRYTVDKHKSRYTLSLWDINVTLAHELGHYLGAFHTFTERDNEAVDSCGDTDYCKDTPSYNKVEYDNYLSQYLLQLSSGQPVNPHLLLARSSCDGQNFQSYNIMDYAVSLGFQISADQKYRMRHVLYYSPLMPGPKKNGANRNTRVQEGRNVQEDQPLQLPITTVR
jgi:zinc-dependent metalloproteinase lipoprotein, BF0631 family